MTVPSLVLRAHLAVLLIGLIALGNGLMAVDTKPYDYGHFKFGGESLDTAPVGFTGVPTLNGVFRKDDHIIGLWIDPNSDIDVPVNNPDLNGYTRWVIARRLSNGTWENLGAPNLVADGVTIDATQLPTEIFDVVPANGVGGALEVFLTFYDFELATGSGPNPVTVKWFNGNWGAPFGATVSYGVWGVDVTVGASGVVGHLGDGTVFARAKIFPETGPAIDLHGLLDGNPVRFASVADVKRGTRILGSSVASQVALDDFDHQATKWIYDTSTGLTIDVPLPPVTLAFPGQPSVAVIWDEWQFFGTGTTIVIQAQSDFNPERHAALVWDPALPSDFSKRFVPLQADDNRVEIDCVNASGTRFAGHSFTEGSESAKPALWTAFNVTPIDVRTEIHPSPDISFGNISNVHDDGLLLTAWGDPGVLIPLPTVTLTSPASSIAEDGAGATVTVTRTGSTLLPLSVGITRSGTGAADALINSGLWDSTLLEITIPAGAASISFPLEAINDTTAENESVTLTLRAAINADLGGRDAGDAHWTYNIGASNFTKSFTIIDTEDDVAAPAKTAFSILSLPLPAGVSGTLTDGTWMGPEAISPDGQWILVGIENSNVRRWYRYSVVAGTWNDLGITISGYDYLELSSISNAGTVVGTAGDEDPVSGDDIKTVPVRALAGAGILQVGTAEGELAFITEDNALWGGHHVTLPADYDAYSTIRSATWASGSSTPATLFTTGPLAGRPSVVDNVAGTFIGGTYISASNQPGLFTATLPSTVTLIPFPADQAGNPAYQDRDIDWACEGLLSSGEGAFIIGDEDDPTAPFVSFRSDGVTSAYFYSPNSDGLARNMVEVRGYAQPGSRKIAVGIAFLSDGIDEDNYESWIWEDTFGRPDRLKTHVPATKQDRVFVSANAISSGTAQIICDGWDVDDVGGYVATKKRIQLLTPRPVVDVSDGVVTLAENAAGTVSMTVTRTSPGNGTLPWALDVTLLFSGSATKDSDFSVVAGASVISQTANSVTIRIPAGSTSATFAIDPTDDGALESDETLVLTVDAASAGYKPTDCYEAGTTAGFTLTSDDTGIAVTVVTTGANPTNTTIPVTVTFAAAMTGFADGELVATNGATVGTISGSGTTYTATVTPTAEGAITISVAGGVATATVGGTPNTDSNLLVVTYDITPPPVPTALDLAAASDSGTTTDDITNDTTPTIDGLAAVDAVAVRLYEGATLRGTDNSIVAGAWSITSSAITGQGVHTFTARSLDALGNESANSTALSITLDTVAPTVTTGISPAVLATATGFTGTITWSEAVTGFLASDLTLTNASAATLAGGPAVYTTALTATVQGTLSFSIGTSVVTDVAGNANATGAALTNATFTPAPVPTISLNGATSPTNVSPIPFQVTFSETVNGFAVGDLLVTNGGAPGAFTETVANTTWTFTVVPSGQGLVTINIGAAAATAVVGSLDSLAATAFSATFDSIDPTAPTGLDLIALNDSGITTDNITNDTTPTITGSGENGATIRLYANAVEIGQAVVGGGTWSITPVIALADNTYSVIATATDAAGNLSADSAALSLTIDTAAPAVPTALDLATASDSGLTTDNITNVTTPTITGIGPASTLVRLYSDAVEVGSAAANGAGAWSINSSLLAQGARILTARSEDVAGNQSAASTGLTVTIDTTAPAVPTALDLATASDTGSLTTDNLTNDTTPTVTGASDASVVVRLYADAVEVGSATATGAGTWSITASTLTAGVKAITARAEDVAGNQSAASTPALSVTIDTTPAAVPSVPDLLAASDSGVSTDDRTNVTTPSFTGTATTGLLVRLYADAVEVGSGTATGGVWTITATTLATGVRAITARSEDAAGNLSAASATLNVTIDSGSPTAPTALDLDAFSDLGTSSSDNITNDTTLTINGSGEVGAIVRVLNGATQVASTTVGGGGTWSVTTSALASGVRSLTATATDVAGNLSPASSVLLVTIDTTAPTVTLGTPTPLLVRSGQTVIVVATYADDVGGSGMGAITLANGNLTLAGSTTGASAAVSGGGLATRTITVTAGTGAGTFTVRIGVAGTAQDVAGNQASTSAVSTAITLDNTLPTVAISTTAPATTASPSVPVRLVFSEAVSGLAGGDLTLVNATVGTLTTVDGGITWNGTLTAVAAGAVDVGLAAAAVADAVGNVNASVAATTLVTFTTSGPTVTVNQATSQADPTSGNVVFTVTFSAPINTATFNASTDIIFGGTAGGVRNASGVADVTNMVFTVTVTGMASPDGTVTANLPANAVLSTTGGLPNQASTSTDNLVQWTAPVGGGGGSSSSNKSSNAFCGLGSGMGLLAILALCSVSLSGVRRGRRS